MTDREPPHPEELSEEEVAALLGSFGDAEPVPADVRDRLDDALADLVRERGAPDDARDEESTVVVPLRSRRRTTTLGLLVAAAFLGAVGLGAAVVGGGISGLVDGVDGVVAGDSAESDSGAGSDTGSAGGESADGDARDRAREESGGRDGPGALSESPQELTADRALPEVGAEPALRAAVRAAGAEEAADRPDTAVRSQRNALEAGRCATPRGSGRLVAVTYRGDRATLVVRRDGEALEGRVYSCSLGLLLDGLRIPSPAE